MTYHQPGLSKGQQSTSVGHLSVDSLSVRIDGRTILADVSLAVSAREVVAVLGRDGAGKTTCFEAIAGLIRTSGGRVTLNGIDVSVWTSDHRAALGLGYLPEEASIFRGLTVDENLLAALEASEPDQEARAEKLEKLLADFELGTVRHQIATSLSGGERRRCEVARALALNPTVLLLDEPFKGLDPTSVSSTKRLISSLKDHGVGVLVSDYDLHDLLEVVTRAYVLHGGRLIFAGDVSELLSNRDVRRAFLGEGFSL